MKKSFHSTAQRRSPLSDIQSLNGGRSQKKDAGSVMTIALPLTSLIDAFSIIVIYLLIGTQNNGLETPTSANINLPVASQSQVIDKDMPILRIEKGLFYLNDKVVTSQALGLRLTELKEKLQQEQKEKNAEKPNIELMIQADTEMAFSDLDPLIKASSLAGIEKLRFAVVPSR